METTFLSMKGFLNKEKIAAAKTVVHSLFDSSSPSPHLILEINSTGGDLNEVLDLAKAMYELKTQKKIKVIVYIHDHALGPAAALAFLADELTSSPFVSWGDIPLQTESALPSNILRNQVRSLINPQNPHARLLAMLADAMSDPSLQMIDDHGWKIVSDSHSIEGAALSVLGQTLVLNQHQIQELGLVKDFLSADEFQKKYHLPLVSDSLSPNQEGGFPLQIAPQVIEKKLQEAIRFRSEGPNVIGYFYIGGHDTPISESTWLYLKKGLEFYKKEPPIFIILELDTPGGEVFAAQKMSDALKEMDTQLNIPIVAFINNWAMSAGAMIAYSSRFITTVKDGSMGAAEPVYAGEGGKMETASEKVNSALRADFSNRASFFNRNPLIAQAMVDKDLILVVRHGELIQLENESQMRLTGADRDLVITTKGKLLTLNAQQMVRDGVADLLLPPIKLPEITTEEKTAGEWPAIKMPLFQVPFFAAIPNAIVKPYQMDWKTQFFVFLASPLVSSLLLMALMIGGYLEMNHPGLTLPGFVAGASLFLIVLSSFSLEVAGWLEFILLFMGLALILTELFVLSTFGVIGILGILLFLGGLFGMLLPDLNSVHFEYDRYSFNAAGQYLIERLAWLSGSFILSLIIIVLLASCLLPSFSLFNRLVLIGNEQNASDGFTAAGKVLDLPHPGSDAKVFAPLRPSGKIIANDRIYDAISVGDFIEEGEQVVIIRLEGNDLFVSRDIGEKR